MDRWPPSDGAALVNCRSRNKKPDPSNNNVGWVMMTGTNEQQASQAQAILAGTPTALDVDLLALGAAEFIKSHVHFLLLVLG